MTFEVEGGLVVKIYNSWRSCSIVHSPKATGTVIVPRFVEIEGIKYTITSITAYSFCGNEIDLLTFPEDSELTTFETNSLSNSHIKKLKIPPSLKTLKDGWCQNLQGLTEIEISPDNKFFTYLDNTYLLGKNESSNQYDTLLYSRYDIENALVPSQVSVIDRYSFAYHKQLKSVTFSDDSNLKFIKNNAFSFSTIQKLFLPENVDKIEDNCFSNVFDLIEITVSPKNVHFSVFDNKYLVRKSSNDSQIFDVLVFANHNQKCAVIPSHIKIISNCAFENFSQLKSISFDSNSSIETINSCSFSRLSGLEKIVFPPSLKKISFNSISQMTNLKTIVFLSKEIRIEDLSFHTCNNVSCIVFPNAEIINISQNSFGSIRDDAKIWVKKDVKKKLKNVKNAQIIIVLIQ